MSVYLFMTRLSSVHAYFGSRGTFSRVPGISEIDMLLFPLIRCKLNKRGFEPVLIIIVCILTMGVPLTRRDFLQSTRAPHFSGMVHRRCHVYVCGLHLCFSRPWSYMCCGIAVSRVSCDRHLLGAASACVTPSQNIEDRYGSHAY